MKRNTDKREREKVAGDDFFFFFSQRGIGVDTNNIFL